MWRGLLLSVLLLNAADLARAEVPCSLPPDEQLKDKCFMAPGTVAGGGMGARMLSMLNFFTIAVDTGCMFLSKPLDDMGHGLSAEAVESYLNYADGCMTVDQAKAIVPIKDLKPAPGQKSVPPECVEEPLVLCNLGMARQIQTSFETRDIARRVLQHKFWMKDHPDKKLEWFRSDVAIAIEEKAVPVHVVLHLRRGDVASLYQKGKSLHRYTTDDEIVQVLSSFCHALESAKIRRQFDAPLSVFVHFMSEGKEEDFPIARMRKALSSIGGKLQLHLDAPVLQSFSHMVAADVLLYGVSSFPELAARYYNNGVARPYATRRSNDGDRDGAVIKQAFDDCFVDEVRNVLVRKVSGATEAAPEEKPVACGGAKAVPSNMKTANFFRTILTSEYEFAPTFEEDREAAARSPEVEAPPEEKTTAKRDQFAGRPIRVNEPRSAPTSERERKNRLRDATRTKVIVRERFRFVLEKVRERRRQLVKYYGGNAKILARAVLEDDTDPSENTLLVSKMALKMLRGVARDIVGKGRELSWYTVNLKVAGIGGAIMSGFPGTEKTSFLELFKLGVEDLWNTLHVGVEIRNSALYSHEEDPFLRLLCLESLVGEDVDMVFAEVMDKEVFSRHQKPKLYKFVRDHPGQGKQIKRREKKTFEDEDEEGEGEGEEEAASSDPPPIDPEEAAILETYMRAIYSVKSQPAAMLMYFDTAWKDRDRATRAADLLDYELYQYHNMSRTIYSPFGRALDNVRWQAYKHYKSAGEMPEGCTLECLAKRNCDLRDCPLDPRKGDFFHDQADLRSFLGAEMADPPIIPKRFHRKEHQLFVDRADGGLPFLLGHDLIASQIIYHHLVMMERALNVVLDYVRENEAGYLVAIVKNIVSGSSNRPKLPRPVFCEQHFCAVRTRCFLSQKPMFAMKNNLGLLVENSDEINWTLDHPGLGDRCNADKLNEACSATLDLVPSEETEWSRCDTEMYNCAFSSERLAIKGSADTGEFVIHLNLNRLEDCKVLLYEADVTDNFAPMGAVLGNASADDAALALLQRERPGHVANWHYELRVFIDNEPTKAVTITKINQRFMLSIDLVEHFDDEVCSRRIGPDRVAISVKVQPIKDVSKAKMCTGDGGTWERLFKKKKCIPEGHWLGYTLQKACTMNKKTKKCQVRDGYTRDANSVVAFISHVIAL